MMSEQNHTVSTQLRFCLSSLEHKDLAEQAAASLSALLCENVDEQLHASLSHVTILLKGERQLAWIIEQLTNNLAATARPLSCLQAMQQLAAAVVSSITSQSHLGAGTLDTGSQETRLSSVMQPLIKSSCSARGKRPHCDGPGSLLASAIDAVPVLLHHLNEPLHAIARQIGSLMLQGGMPTDNCGTYKALKAVWSKLQSFTLHDPRLTNTTIMVIQRALSANLHWSVVVEALRALSTCFLALPAQENRDAAATHASSEIPDALSVVVKHGPMLHETLKKARYHQIKHCRDAASEVMSILKSMVPEAALRSAAPEDKVAKAVTKKPSAVPSRKGPWLHQKGSGAPKEAKEDTSTSKTGKPAARPKSAALATLAAAQRTARAASRPLRSLSAHNVPRNENLDFGIQVYAPQKPEAPQDTRHADQPEEIAADTVLLAPRRPSAPLSPASKKASRPQSRSLSEQSQAPQSPSLKKLSQRDTSPYETIPKPQAPSNGASNFVAAEEVLEPVCIGVPVPHFMQIYPQTHVLEHSAEVPGKATVSPTSLPSPVRAASQTSASQIPTPVADVGRAQFRRSSSSPGRQACQLATDKSPYHSRSRSPKRPSQSQACIATGNGRQSVVEVAAVTNVQPSVCDKQPPSQHTGQGHGSASDQEQLAALLGCSPPKSAAPQDEATSQTEEKPEHQACSSEEDPHHEEASLRHHARPNSEASLRTQNPEPRECVRGKQSPELPNTLTVGESYQHLPGHEQGGVSGQHQTNTSDPNTGILKQHQIRLGTAAQSKDTEQVTMQQHSDPAVPSTSASIHATSAEFYNAPALPASIRFSTTTEQGVDIPVQHLVMTLEVPDGDSSAAVQTAAQQVATLLTTLRPPATVTTQLASRPRQRTTAAPSAPQAATAVDHGPLHPPFPAFHQRSPSPSTSTCTPPQPQVQPSSLPQGISIPPHNPNRPPLPCMAQYPTASAKPNSASLRSSNRHVGHCPLPQPTPQPLTTTLQPAATQPFHLGPVPTPNPAQLPAPCAAAPQSFPALAATPQPSSQVPAAGLNNAHHVGTPQGVWPVDLTHHQPVFQAVQDPHPGALAQHHHHEHAPTYSSRSLETAADLIESSLHQCTAPQRSQEPITGHQAQFSSNAQNHRSIAPCMSHARHPWTTAPISGTSDADTQTHPHSACLGPPMQQQQLLADTHCFTPMPVPQRAAVYDHQRRARSWSPTRRRYPFVAEDAPQDARLQAGVPAGRARPLQRLRSSSLQATPLCPPGELYTDPFVVPVPYISPQHQHLQPLENTRYTSRHPQAQPSQPYRPHQEQAPAWEPMDLGRSISAHGGSQPAHMQHIHSPGCQALSLMISRLQSLRADAIASEPAAHHRVLPPRELLARLSEPLEIAQMSDTSDRCRPGSRQCWRPPRPPHSRVQSIRHTPLETSRSASPNIMRAHLPGINRSLQCTPPLSSTTCTSRLSHQHLVEQSEAHGELYPAHSRPMPKSSSAPECRTQAKSKPPWGSAGKLRSHLSDPTQTKCKSRCRSAYKIEKRSPKQAIPGRRAASLSPSSRKLAALRSSLDQKLAQGDPGKARILKGSSCSPPKGQWENTANLLVPDQIPAQAHSMKSLQTMLESSAPGSAGIKHRHGGTEGCSHRTSRKGKSESVGEGCETPLKRQQSSLHPRAVSSEERDVDTSRQKKVPSRSNSCSSAHGQSQSVNNSPRSSSISLPDNQMKSPRSEYLLDFEENQHHFKRMETNLLSNGRHASPLHASTVGSHTSMLCTEVLSLKAVLES